MRQEQKQLKLNIKSVDKNNSVIDQQTLTLTKHTNDQKYLVISKNDFGKNFRINAGIFNKKTRFILTENHSLLVLSEDSEANETENLKIKEVSIKELISDEQEESKSNNYMIYMIPIFTIDQNYYVKLKDKNDPKKILDIELNFELGRAFGRKMKKVSYNEDIDTMSPNINKDQEYFLNKVIPNNILNSDNKINFDKRILLSSNYKFLLGILFELYEEKMRIKNINIYLITTILNILGASYSIRKIKDSEDASEEDFYIRFKLPLIFKKFIKNLKYLKNPERNKDNIYNKKLKMIRNKKYIISEEEKGQGKVEKVELINFDSFKKYYYDAKFSLKKDPAIESDSFDSSKKLKDLINLGLIELMPTNDFKYIPINYGKVYDFVTEGVNEATNYILPGLPLLKNSDGDILALIGIWTEDAARNADEKFGINKKTIVSELDGKPYSWIDIDSVLGLHNFTK